MHYGKTKNKAIVFLLIIMVLIGIVTFVNRDGIGYMVGRVIIESKLKNINPDAIITYRIDGGECYDEWYYYICNNTVYKCYIYHYCPFTNAFPSLKWTDKGYSKYTLNVYEIDDELRGQLQQFILKVMDVGNGLKNPVFRLKAYKIIIDEKMYNVDDSKTMESLLNQIDYFRKK